MCSQAMMMWSSSMEYRFLGRKSLFPNLRNFMLKAVVSNLFLEIGILFDCSVSAFRTFRCSASSTRDAMLLPHLNHRWMNKIQCFHTSMSGQVSGWREGCIKDSLQDEAESKSQLNSYARTFPLPVILNVLGCSPVLCSLLKPLVPQEIAT
jgi:hypothetical protein